MMGKHHRSGPILRKAGRTGLISHGGYSDPVSHRWVNLLRPCCLLFLENTILGAKKYTTKTLLLKKHSMGNITRRREF